MIPINTKQGDKLTIREDIVEKGTGKPTLTKGQKVTVKTVITIAQHWNLLYKMMMDEKVIGIEIEEAEGQWGVGNFIEYYIN